MRLPAWLGGGGSDLSTHSHSVQLDVYPVQWARLLVNFASLTAEAQREPTSGFAGPLNVLGAMSNAQGQAAWQRQNRAPNAIISPVPLVAVQPTQQARAASILPQMGPKNQTQAQYQAVQTALLDGMMHAAGK